jgi:hypothetical protein
MAEPAWLAELIETAGKATPGPWQIEPGNFVARDGLVVAEVPCQGANDDDVPYIAACSPERLRALIAVVRVAWRRYYKNALCGCPLCEAIAALEATP